VVELEGELDWEQSHEIKYKLIRFLSEEVVVGVIFIFHALENPDRDLEEVIPHLFGFLQDINISPKHIKYLTMDERIKALLKRDSLLRRIEEVSSYAEAFMKIQSLTFNKSNIGLDIDFIKEDTKLVENVYDETGNLIKKAGEVFTTEDIEKLRRDAIQKIYYARELSGLGVQVNNLPNFKENIEQIIMNQAESAEEEAILPEDKDAASKMVLIIEDDSASQKILSKVMNKMGYQFKICSNGNEGLKTAIQFNPNLIILDLMMPGMNGVQFIQSYKDVRKKGQAPILVLSAVNRMDIIQSVVKMGVKDYILKPVNLKMLVEKVHNNII
jgi:DNA-binding response OmpR family regulator